MKPSEAAAIIGCDESHVRRLIREGSMEATYIEVNGRKFYDVTMRETKRVRDNVSNRGRARGPLEN